MSILSAIHQFGGICLNNIIHSMYAPAPAGSSTEHVFSLLFTMRDEDGNSQGRVV